MNNLIESIRFPSDFLSMIDSIHDEASAIYQRTPAEAKLLAKSRSELMRKVEKNGSVDSVIGDSGYNTSKGSGKVSSSGIKIK